MTSTLNELLRIYRFSRPNLSDNGFAQMEWRCAHFHKFLGREALISDLTTERVGEFMLTMRADTTRKRSNKTINNCRDTLRCLSKFAVKKKLLSEPIETSRLREEERIPNAPTIDELNRIIQACWNAPVLPIKAWHGHRNRWWPEDWVILVLLIWQTGHRIDCLLECPDAALGDDRILRMPANLTKMKREQQHELSPELFKLIDEQRPTKRARGIDKLLPWPMSRHLVRNYYTKYILKPAGIPNDRLHKFHYLRRGSGSHLYAVAKDKRVVMDHLGHKDPRTTELYLAPMIAYQKVKACEVLPPLNVEPER